MLCTEVQAPADFPAALDRLFAAWAQAGSAASFGDFAAGLGAETLKRLLEASPERP